MTDLWIFFFIAIVSGVVVLLGFISIVGRRFTKPTQDLVLRIKKLEQEVNDLKK